jgi:branched-chain amino acid transport system permease protein
VSDLARRAAMERRGARQMIASRLGPGVVFVLVAAVLLALAPLVLSDAILSPLGKALVAALFALAFNLLAGQAGMLSFGHAAYFAFGAFATIHMMVGIEKGFPGLPTPLLPLIGGAAGLISGLVAGYFASLRSGVYFSMVTLAISELFYTIAPNLSGLFGGETGIISIRHPFGRWTFGFEAEVYLLILAWVTLSMLALYLYTRTLFGRLTLAIRENERRLPALGFDVHKTKVIVFAISGLFSGIAGGLLAISTESANYVLFHLGMSTTVVLHTIIGGTTVFLGPAVGAVGMTMFGFATSDVTHFWLLYQGLLFIAVMLWAPRGLTPLLIEVGQGLAQRTLNPVGVALRVLCIILAGVGVVLLIEFVGAIFNRDYAAAVQRTGQWADVIALRRSWSPTSVITWAIPVALIALAVVVSRFGRSAQERADG